MDAAHPPLSLTAVSCVAKAMDDTPEKYYDRIRNYSIKELQSMCIEKGLPITGIKDVLAARIAYGLTDQRTKEARKKKETTPPVSHAPTVNDESDGTLQPNKLQKMTYSDFKAEETKHMGSRAPHMPFALPPYIWNDHEEIIKKWYSTHCTLDMKAKAKFVMQRLKYKFPNELIRRMRDELCQASDLAGFKSVFDQSNGTSDIESATIVSELLSLSPNLLEDMIKEIYSGFTIPVQTTLEQTEDITKEIMQETDCEDDDDAD